MGTDPKQIITENTTLYFVRETKARVTTYTDRSAPGITTTEGAAMIAAAWDPADPVIVHASTIRGAELTTSQEEDKSAFLLALDGAKAKSSTERITLCSDSHSPLKATQSGEHDAVHSSDWATGKATPSASEFQVI